MQSAPDGARGHEAAPRKRTSQVGAFEDRLVPGAVHPLCEGAASPTEGRFPATGEEAGELRLEDLAGPPGSSRAVDKPRGDWAEAFTAGRSDAGEVLPAGCGACTRGSTGSGIGTQLLRRGLAWAVDEHPGREVYLEVLSANTRAIAFYERHGARCTDERTCRFQQGFELPGFEYAWPMN
ncbi:GNAT family N-acetyltransferase [Nonomuraea sp. NPDC046802]|uniref:GNAT family N-acetyltransferase n=1 Tax=Nonomuraea sp. NPDC046802 TaxID=3154919 RepID=UPI0033C7E6DC